LYEQVFQVLKPAGYYQVEHWSPFHMQLLDSDAWDGTAYRLVHPQCPGVPILWESSDENGTDAALRCWHFIHPLDHLIGGLCDAGFRILHFAEALQGDLSAEPGTPIHLAAYFPPTFTI